MVLAVVGVWVFVATTWRELPERIPIHFDAAGNPDGWASRDSPIWFLMPGTAMLVCGLSVALGLFMHRIPLKYINFPHKERLADFPEAQDAVRASLSRMFLWMGLIEAALFWLITWQMAEVSKGTSTRLDPAPIFVVVGGLIVVPIVWSVRVMRLTRSLTEARDQGVPPRS